MTQQKNSTQLHHSKKCFKRWQKKRIKSLSKGTKVPKKVKKKNKNAKAQTKTQGGSKNGKHKITHMEKKDNLKSVLGRLITLMQYT